MIYVNIKKQKKKYTNDIEINKKNVIRGDDTTTVIAC